MAEIVDGGLSFNPGSFYTLYRRIKKAAHAE